VAKGEARAETLLSEILEIRAPPLQPRVIGGEMMKSYLMEAGIGLPIFR
jgi:hypothetical protein